MKPARYAVTFGLSGLYLPDCHEGVYEFHTRRELATFIRGTLEAFDLPVSLFRQIGIRKLWRFIACHGSSNAHFTVVHGAYELVFHGLTEEEFAAENQEE